MIRPERVWPLIPVMTFAILQLTGNCRSGSFSETSYVEIHTCHKVGCSKCLFAHELSFNENTQSPVFIVRLPGCSWEIHTLRPTIPIGINLFKGKMITARRATRGGHLLIPENFKALHSNFEICRNFQRIKMEFGVLII